MIDPSSRPEAAVQALAITGIAMSLLAPPALLERGPVLCPFRLATGRPCPSCGLTRSVVAAGHLDIRRAVAMHPVGPAMLGATAAGVIGHSLGYRPWSAAWRVINSPRAGPLVAGLVLLWGLYRAVRVKPP